MSQFNGHGPGLGEKPEGQRDDECSYYIITTIG